MSFQTLFASSAAGLAAFYFIRGVVQDLRQPAAGGCGKCSSGACPVAKKG